MNLDDLELLVIAERDPMPRIRTSPLQRLTLQPRGWSSLIVAHLADGKHRTFQRLCVELTNQHASAMLRSEVRKGLELALQEGYVKRTPSLPVFFRFALC